MLTESIQRPDRYVRGPNGPLTMADLPRPSTDRWVIRRKAEVVAAVRGGLLSHEQACSRYALSAEEYLSWQDAIDRHGFGALRIKHLNEYRQRGPGQILSRAGASRRILFRFVDELRHDDVRSVITMVAALIICPAGT